MKDKLLKDDDRPSCFIFKLSGALLKNILLEVVLQEEDAAYMTLSLACSRFRDIVGDDKFKNQAHFLWLESVTCWKKVISLQTALLEDVLILHVFAAHLVMLGRESDVSPRAFIQKPSTLDFADLTACRSVLMS
nr:uncharacterized protein LOC129418313 isoform X1 [Misgurnus anguillicaudatus]XP_055029231.1 uncharacterized protein LOC129418313 isoform X1 [Misgurnus anguillicaudatus]XP_055029232.1 uncharacterized protein LOC129418313 isoform X1 [Misgurnus anguillicaudatus]XP_055029234.1 uncharacterized protein LOC129418313 isoform X1 [Misgurnus anguillicaudatus]